ncbi:hypothetical protein EDB89DRAFT_2069928 [Lactarius sanguifluus]|nr:hypothetical protein EDB89DRAFT_2069928 [Lactarius sanguifluus]
MTGSGDKEALCSAQTRKRSLLAATTGQGLATPREVNLFRTDEEAVATRSNDWTMGARPQTARDEDSPCSVQVTNDCYLAVAAESRGGTREVDGRSESNVTITRIVPLGRKNAPTKPVTRFPTLEEGLAIQTLHEATLQELIEARNYPLLHIIRERNELMCERNVLRGTDIEFPEYDYLTPLGEECTLPYMAMWADNKCCVLPFRGVKPRNPWAVYPVDRRRFDASTQTDDADADTTLAEIDTPDSKSHSEAQVVLDDPQAIDRCKFGLSTQTKDADMALVEGDPSDSKLCSEAQVALDDDKKPCKEHKDAKKRKVSN